ncbi:hydroxypyruvate isomerase [Caenibius tardaugens NBRC 16725]|uniref:Hydroxypyruvate isomerase n=1 Tax=Caenibius tardaugens NBRC 16725 TaxID=1219035 RepID=U3A302_9SPHN|nr:sugar phosphate isomerase/epimerase family protein [Caenibius tardaugens]GAD49138.1 hydroxypyruvate isomerase [Caenibius tardaugens NBRC 16725]
MVQPIIHSLRMAGHLGLRSPDGPLFAHSAPSRDAGAQLDYLAQQGFAGAFDIYLKVRADAERAAISAKLAEHGLEMGTFNNDLAHWDKPLWSRNDADAQALIRASIESSIATVAQMGSGAAVCVTGLDAAYEKPAQIAAMIANLRRIAPLAEDAGLTLMIEPVAPQWIPGLLIDSMADGAAIVRAVDSPAVRLLFDVGHCAMMGDDVVQSLDAHWDLIGGIQIADVPGRVEPRAGVIDWVPVLGRLIDRGFDGLVEVELLTKEDSAQGEANLLASLRAIDNELKERPI